MDKPSFAMSLTRIAICFAGGVLFLAAAFMAYPADQPPPQGLRIFFVFCSLLCFACVVYMELMHGTVRKLLRPGPGSEFRQKAQEISRHAHAIAGRLETHEGTQHQQDYGRDMAKTLKAALAVYDRAVFKARSRAAAADALSDVNRIITAAGQAAVKGDMGFDFGDHGRQFHELETLFKESRYRDVTL